MAAPKQTDPFYKSARWRAVRLLALQRDLYQCRVCGCDVSASGAARVDHIRERATHPELELDLDNLRTLCPRHDNQAHAEKGGKAKPGAGRVERFKRGVDAGGWPR
jgi:5-methylcytosine-specific restriction endonuclease McrA